MVVRMLTFIGQPGQRSRRRRLVLAAILLLTFAAGAAEAPAFLRRDQLLEFIGSDGRVQPVRSEKDWSHRRRQILGAMQQVMGNPPGEDRRVPLDMTTESEEPLDGGVTRKRITFAVEPNDRIAAYLLLPKPKQQGGKIPAVLCLHQTTPTGKASPAGLSDRAELHYALELAQRGYATLAPDYPYFGDSKNANPYKQGYVSATMKGIWNHMRAIDLLLSLPQVDRDRIGAIGHSLGGHNALFVSAFDPRIKAAVTNCGFNAFPKYYNGNLTGWSSDKYMPRIATVYNKDPRQMPFDFGEVLAAIAPRAVLVIAPLKDSNFEVSGVRDCLTAAKPVFELLGASDNLVAEHPDCAHEFPRDMRDKAYAFLDQHLRSR
jgi:dienelactone hydrolase